MIINDHSESANALLVSHPDNHRGGVRLRGDLLDSCMVRGRENGAACRPPLPNHTNRTGMSKMARADTRGNDLDMRARQMRMMVRL